MATMTVYVHYDIVKNSKTTIEELSKDFNRIIADDIKKHYILIK